jgi:hypothetical protein
MAIKDVSVRNQGWVAGSTGDRVRGVGSSANYERSGGIVQSTISLRP